jgi:hypothetical protein
MTTNVKRAIRIEGNFAFVSLTRGYEAVIDACDAELVGQFNWFAKPYPHTVYVARQSFKKDGPQKTIFLHRLLMGNPNGLEIDHVDGNGLNNVRCNLRASTGSQNNHNKGPLKNNTSGFKGVTWHKKAKRWQAHIKKDRRTIYIGLFDCPRAAADAYAAKAKELYGEWARSS